MTPLRLAQAFLLDLACVALGLPLAIVDLRGRAAQLALDLIGECSQEATDAREFLVAVAAGDLLLEGAEVASRARRLAHRLEPIAWPVSGVPADRPTEVGAGGRGRKFISAADPGADLSDIDVLICPDDVDVVLGLVTSEQVARSVREDCASCGRALYRTPDPRTAGLPVTCLVCAVGEERAADARQAAAPACPHCGATAAVPLSSGLRCTNRWHEVRR